MPSVWIEFPPADWRRLTELDEQLYEVLYRDFSVAETDGWRHNGEFGTLAVAVADDGSLYGSGRLLASEDDDVRQIRQLAVVESARRFGVGRALVSTLEQVAASQGAVSAWVNARDSAYDFYERLGYQFAGDTFTSELTGIPHRKMVKQLSGWRCVSCRRHRAGIWLPTTAG